MEQFASAIESVVPEPFPSSSGHSQESSQELSEQLNKQVEALKHEVCHDYYSWGISQIYIY